MAADPVLLGLAFSAGVATFFSPCSVALVPAYVGYYVGLEEEAGDGDGEAGAWAAAREGVRFGGSAAAGILALFLAGGALLYVARARLALDPARVGGAVTALAVGVALAIVVMGLLMLARRSPAVQLPLDPPETRTAPAMAAFGVLFAVGSMGCTLPVLAGVLAQAFTQGPVGAFLTFLAYGAGLALLMALVGVGLSVAEEEVTSRLRRARRHATPAAGLVLVAAGLYMLYYYLAVI